MEVTNNLNQIRESLIALQATLQKILVAVNLAIAILQKHVGQDIDTGEQVNLRLKSSHWHKSGEASVHKRNIFPNYYQRLPTLTDEVVALLKASNRFYILGRLPKALLTKTKMICIKHLRKLPVTFIS